MQSITSDSCYYLKSYLNFDARAPSLPLLNFPFKHILCLQSFSAFGLKSWESTLNLKNLLPGSTVV